MFFAPGFFGTSAPFYLDLVSIYFALLPFFILYSVSFVIKKQYKTHFVSQFFILGLTLLVVVLFETGLRIDGGFETYVKESNFSYIPLLLYLFAHIVLSVITLIYWTYFAFSSYKAHKREDLDFEHKRKGRSLFMWICLTSLSGLFFYLLLFVL